jgi:hypothetical protein
VLKQQRANLTSDELRIASHFAPMQARGLKLDFIHGQTGVAIS